MQETGRIEGEIEVMEQNIYPILAVFSPSFLAV
jgi:hypothetical protein